MKKKNDAIEIFKEMINKIFQYRLHEMTREEAKAAVEGVADCNEKMYWLYCSVIGIKEGSTYAQGARRVKKYFRL